MIISHSEDPDGIFAAASLYRLAEQELLLVPYRKQEELFAQAAASGERVTIADLSYKPSLQDVVSRMDIGSWFDHHDGTINGADYLLSQGINLTLDKGSCSTKLVQETLLPQDPYTAFLADLAQAHDFPGTDKTNFTIANQAQKVIALYNCAEDWQALGDFTKEISHGDAWFNGGLFTSELNRKIAEFEKREYSAREQLNSSKMIHTIQGKKIAVSHGDAILPPKEGPRQLREQGGADGYLVIYQHPQNQALFFRDESSDFDAAKFCSYMGGGGRGGDGGFTLRDTTISPQNFSEVKEGILEQLNEFLQSKDA